MTRKQTLEGVVKNLVLIFSILILRNPIVRVRSVVMMSMMSIKFTILMLKVLNMLQAVIMIPKITNPGGVGVSKVIAGGKKVEVVIIIGATLQTALVNKVKGIQGVHYSTVRSIRIGYLRTKLSLLMS